MKEQMRSATQAEYEHSLGMGPLKTGETIFALVVIFGIICVIISVWSAAEKWCGKKEEPEAAVEEDGEEEDLEEQERKERKELLKLQRQRRKKQEQ